jgi:2-polyprenyl-6-methoxyphenol hydroxylase-like FAD-dependent oxidoreductase
MPLPPIGEQAIVIGAGIGGLAAAQVLSDHFERVIVLERDEIPDEATARAGVPQGRQPHAMLCGGLRALGRIFPDLDRDLVEAGAVPFDSGLQTRREHADGTASPQREFGLVTFSLTRPLLEHILRHRLATRRNVMLRGRSRALEVLGTADGTVVTAVRCETAGRRAEILAADLVVDASGRAVPTLDFLDTAGWPRPEETTIGVDIGYATAVFAIPERDQPGFTALICLPQAPDSTRSGCLLRIENGRWQALLSGRGADGPPADADAFMAYAMSLPTPTLHDAIRHAERQGEIARFGFPESAWRHFGRLHEFPCGLLPLGDAICRFNPVYGQGMSVAAMEADLLRLMLRAQAARPDPLATLSLEFLAEAETLIDTPWTLSALPDFAHPQTRGERPAGLEGDLGLLAGLNRLAGHDPEVHRLLLEVHHLLKPHQALRTPELARRARAEMAAA